MTGPAVSVLLTSYNRPRWLPQAVESVYAQTMSDWELIVLDDNSTDPLVHEYLASLWNRPGTVIYKSAISGDERAETCRYATQINVGLQLARGRHITYLCDDDWYAPSRLELMSGMLDSRPDIGVVYTQQAIMDEAGENITSLRHAPLVQPNAYCAVDHSSVMHTAHAGQVAGGWDENREHWTIGDAVFWRRLNEAGYVFHLVPSDEPLDFSRNHPNGVNKLGRPY